MAKVSRASADPCRAARLESVVKRLFWLAVGVPVYSWIGYPALLWLASRLLPLRESGGDQSTLPRVTLLVTVHNGAKWIEPKLRNCLELDYPRELLQILIASDGSTDGTDDVVRRYRERGVELVRVHPQRGKTAAQNAALDHCRGDIIVFSDVSAMLDRRCLRLLTQRFTDPRVGGVAPLLLWVNTEISSVARGSAFYWRYEQVLWQFESRLRLLAWAPGSCMAVRRTLIRPLPETYGEDVVLPLQVASQGYRFLYEPAAVAKQDRDRSPEAEYRARVRMTTRSLAGTLHVWPLHRWIESPALTWAVVSHKLLRWLTPYFMTVAMLSNVALWRRGAYPALLRLQLGFYALAALGWARPLRRLRIPGARAAFSFCMVSFAFAVGVWQAARGQQIRIFSTEGRHVV